MPADYVQYALVGLGIVLGIALLCVVSIRYERGRRRALDRMTPEERREEEVFRRGVFKRR